MESFVGETVNKKQLECIRVRLNKILRIILSCNIYTPINKLYSSSGLLKLENIYKLQTSKFMYQLRHGKLPLVGYFMTSLWKLNQYVATTLD